MKIKQILCLVTVAVLSLCLLCSCAKEEAETPYPQVIATDKNGNEYTEEVFSYYAHYTHDMMQSSFNSSTYYYYFSGDFASYLENYVDEDQTTHIYEYALTLAKGYYEDYLVCEKMFDELKLTFDDDTQTAIDSYLNSFSESVTDEQLATLCDEIGISKDELMNILVYHSYKAIALQNYYCGQGGEHEIKEEEIKKYYNENYLRFRYVALSKYGSDNKKLSETELALVAQNASKLLKEAQDGADFAELIKANSSGYLSEETIDSTIEAYKNSKELTEEQEQKYRDALHASNEELLTRGMICDLDGIYDISAYNSYGYTVDEDIVTALQSMKVGEFAKVETDAYVWIIEKCDINESEEYLTSKSSEIRSTLASDAMDDYYTFWLNQMKLTYSDDVVSKYDPRNLTTLSWMSE